MVDATEYHERTKHSPRSVREDDFRLDHSNRPRPYTVYRDLPRRPLRSVRVVQQPTLSVVAESAADPLAGAEQPAPGPPDRETLATLCYEASGVVKTVEANGGVMPFRAASCTGKLYHVDLYLVCGDSEGRSDASPSNREGRSDASPSNREGRSPASPSTDGLDAGVYHFDPRTFALDVLREGDHRGVLAEAAGGYAALEEAPVAVVATSTWWRNAWKYRNRTYRHAFWDSGTVLANLLAAAHALDLRAEVVTGVADHPLVELLGLDPTHEAPLEVVALGAGDAAPEARAVDPIDPDTEPLSDRVVDYPLVHEAWEASALADAGEARTWREGVRDAGAVGRVDAGDGERESLSPVDHETASARPLHRTVVRRGSCRAYADDPVSSRRVATVLDRATRGVPADWNGGDDPDGGAGGHPADGLRFNDVYCLLTDVDGVPDGTYQYHPAAGDLERLGDVDARTKTHLALDQRWAGDAHANVYLMTDVESVVERLGDRGYRLAQLEAGVTLGRLYLAAYAHRDLGGTGLTFYDDEVTAHLSPRAADQTPTCLFAFGKRAE